MRKRTQVVAMHASPITLADNARVGDDIDMVFQATDIARWRALCL